MDKRNVRYHGSAFFYPSILSLFSFSLSRKRMAYCTSGYYAALHTRSTADLYSDDHAATLSAAAPLRRDEDNVFEVDRLITEKRKVVTPFVL